MIDIPVYNITIAAGADYELELSYEFDDGEALADYGVTRIFETLYDGTGSTISGHVFQCSDKWSVENQMLIWEPDEEEVIVPAWHIDAVLREYPEAVDGFPFEFSVGTNGYTLKLSHEVTEKIPFTQGVYDVFTVNPDTLERAKLIYGTAKIIPAVTRGSYV